MSESILAVDAGNTACKGLRIRLDGVVDAQTSVFRSDTEPPNDPHAWWRTFCDVAGRLPTASPPAAACLCGRGNGVALLDAGREPVDLPWREVLARARTYPRRTGVPGRVAGWETVLRAALDAAPESARRIVRVCGVKDYLNLRLTGEWATDPASSGCRSWPDELSAGPLHPEMLPPIRPADAVLGTARGDADSSVPAGTPVLVGSHDGVCANIGTGMLAVGDGCVTLGTQGVLRVNTAGPLVPAASFATFTYPYVGETWTSGGDVLDGGAAVRWMARLLGLDSAESGVADESFARFDALAASSPAGANGLLFVPYLRGTISPRYDLDRRAILLGLTAGQGRGGLARAALEGTALALRHIRDTFVSAGGSIRRLSLTGGGARSRVWPAIVAGVLNTPFERADPDASARGAAILAAVGLRAHTSLAEACAAMIRDGGGVAPNSADAARYDSLYQRYRAAVDRGAM